MTGSGSGSSADDQDRRDDRDRSANAPETDDSKRPTGREARRSSDGPTERRPSSDRSSSGRSTWSSGSGRSSRKPARANGSASSRSIEDAGILRWAMTSDDGIVVYARDLATSVGAVALIALLLFGISGVWPPLVAVESGSMEPHMERGDMIFVVADDRFVGDGAVDGTGIVTLDSGSASGHERFGEAGDVIIFRPDGDAHRTPVIHRAHFWVEEGENWVDERADPALTNGLTCADVSTCRARHDGFITHGDANGGYDQLNRGANTDVVKPEWVEGKAALRIPWLGYIRLTVDEYLLDGTGRSSVVPTAVLAGVVTVAIVAAAGGPGGRR